MPQSAGNTFYLTTVKPILNDWGEVETVICTSKNITKRKLAEDALKKERDKLMKVLKEIKTLSGLLPICASCKKIRDDTGYWNQMEGYIQQHSDPQFSHGICPDCAKKMYPHLDI